MARAWRRRAVCIVVATICVAVAGVVAVARPAVVQRWNIYASSTGGPRDAYPMFLGPFPTRFSCETEARIIVESGGHAYCREHDALDIDGREQALLWDEFWPSARWIEICRARLRGRPIRQISDSSRNLR